jgi:hypothetical protein
VIAEIKRWLEKPSSRASNLGHSPIHPPLPLTRSGPWCGTSGGIGEKSGSLWPLPVSQECEASTPLTPPQHRPNLSELICAANSAGGVMSKMVDAQSITNRDHRHRAGRQQRHDLPISRMALSCAEIESSGLSVMLYAYVFRTWSTG